MAKLTNRYNRYDKNSGLWIQARKRVYLYWFRFLQEAEASPDYEVDWTRYEAWGGRDAIFPPSKGDFDAWWEANWRDLFGMKTRHGEPQFPLTKVKVQADRCRVALLVYQIDQKYPDATRIEVAERLRARLGKQSAPFLSKLALLFEVDGSNYEYISRSVSRFRKHADDHLKNVCRGNFP